MRTLYLINNTMPNVETRFTMAYDELDDAIKHVENTILYDQFFENLSKKERTHACLEWLIKLQVA